MATLVSLGSAVFLAYLAGCASPMPGPVQSSFSTIRVVMDNNYPPYVFLDNNGQPQGILVDQWRLWEQKTGVKVKLTATDWNSALQRMQAGEFDVIDTIFENPAREKNYDFTRAYANLDVPIYFSNNISGIIDLSSLKGFSVAAKAGDNSVELLHSNGIDQIILYNSYEAIIQAAKDHKLVIFMADKPPADYFLAKYNLQNQFNATIPVMTGQFHRAVTKGNSALLNLVQNGFDQITPAEYATINRRWMGIPLANSVLFRYLGIAFGILALLGLILVWINATLQKIIREKTSQMAALFASMQDVVIVYDRNGRYLDVPSTASPGIYHPIKTMLGRPVDEMLPVNVATIIKKAIRTALERKTTEAVDYSLVIDHQEFWFNGKISPIDGDRVILVARDCTQKRLDEKALCESEERYRALVETAPDGILVVQDGLFMFANPAAVKLFGAESEQDLVGTAFNDRFISSELHSHSGRLDSGNFPFQANPLAIFSSGNNSQPIEMVMRKLDGETIQTEINAFPLENDQTQSTIILCRDVTARKRIEQAYIRTQFMIENVPLPVLAIAKDGTITYANKNANTFVGLPVGRLAGQKLWVYDQNFSPELWEKHWDDVTASGSRTIETTVTGCDGNPQWVEQIVNHVVFEDEEFLVNFSRVVTDRKQAEERLRQVNFELSRAYDATLKGWSDALEMREHETAGHSQRVVARTLLIAREYGFNEGDLADIQRGALLHDIGKMGIPDDILMKKGPLTEDEWAIMRTHPNLAYHLLSGITYLQPALDIPYCHHEHWDGTGYPQGLSGKEIPLTARIFSVVDVWDSLLSKRPYKPAWTETAAATYLKAEAGKLFDPEVVDVFLRLVCPNVPIAQVTIAQQ